MNFKNRLEQNASNPSQGNEIEITALKKALAKYQIGFTHVSGVSDAENLAYIRKSKIAPAIACRWQVENDYLPCRMWKNISYGQLGISNVPKFEDVFGDCSVPGATIEALVDYALTLPERQYRNLIREQQEIVKNHTYLDRLLAIAKAFDFVRT
jgi:hypothetical protein